MTFDRPSLEALDQHGVDVLVALNHAGRVSATASHPSTFVCLDGRTYWVKNSVQQGLCAELIAGRLAARLNVGPQARIIAVPPAAVPSALEFSFSGVVVGTEDQPGTINARDIDALVPAGGYDPATIDRRSLARVVVFQSWIGVSDEQVLLRLTDGMVLSIDHGDCFGSTGSLEPPKIVVAPIKGVPPHWGKDQRGVRDMVTRIEGLADPDILQAVAAMPDGTAWRSEIERRLEIAAWLGFRRDRIREVMEEWLRA